MREENRNDIAAEILEQIAGEASARRDYERLIASGGLTEADVAIIREIEADETNHIGKLLDMVKRYDGGIEPAGD